MKLIVAKMAKNLTFLAKTGKKYIFFKCRTTFIEHPELHIWSKFQLNISWNFQKTWMNVSKIDMGKNAKL